MPKAKPKVPKTEKMWMGWNQVDGRFFPSRWGLDKPGCLSRMHCSLFSKDLKPVRVRIIPEAEYQRLRKAAKP